MTKKTISYVPSVETVADLPSASAYRTGTAFYVESVETFYLTNGSSWQPFAGSSDIGDMVRDHIDDNGNPHQVTAAQVGALEPGADAATLGSGSAPYKHVLTSDGAGGSAWEPGGSGGGGGGDMLASVYDPDGDGRVNQADEIHDDVNTVTAAQARNHLDSASNPHNVTPTQIGAMPLAGGTFTGEVTANAQIKPAVDASLPSSGTVVIDFAGPMVVDLGVLTGDVTFEAINLAPGRTVTVFMATELDSHNLFFPGNWGFINFDGIPTQILAMQRGVLTLTAFGDIDYYVLAVWGSTSSPQFHGIRLSGALQVDVNSWSLPTSGTVTLDLSSESTYDIGTLTGNVTFDATGIGIGHMVTVYLESGGTTRYLTFPSEWRFVGSKPTEMPPNTLGVLTLFCRTNSASGVVAAWAVEG